MLNVRFWNVFEEIQANLRYRKKEERWEGFHKFKSKSSDLRFSNIRNGLCELLWYRAIRKKCRKSYAWYVIIMGQSTVNLTSIRGNALSGQIWPKNSKVLKVKFGT